MGLGAISLRFDGRWWPRLQRPPLLAMMMVCYLGVGVVHAKSGEEVLDSEQIAYFVDYDIPFPFELRVNDVIAAGGTQAGPGPETLNDYILESGEQSVTLRVWAPDDYNGGQLRPRDILALTEAGDRPPTLYMVDKRTDEFKKLRTLAFAPIDHDLPFVEQTWHFNAEVPYILEGWRSSEDLSLWDREELEQATVARFSELRNLLNSGDGKGFVDELAASNEELFVSSYFPRKKRREFVANLEEVYGSLKGLVPPIENYRLRIMGRGRAVTLEATGKYQGHGVLTTEDTKEGTVYLISVVLHKPKDSKELEVARITGWITGMEIE
ncbi:hypothetical protein B5T_00834 [Alloalcanivorax dieselolei B5]|uniref:Uncharacterized protein n=1 Tax=Alcanivorax dieselolei (strain DSM 16502 / CGMCC 1.3690 / MCCC 1A00001 / B-5) TaxID=930169 RepID=K0C964_ALCDB|nr:hypothetical protein [Alloalcanivorax dieselolei]AFT69118.1 hypothetical protein B5T_00834 [Alloalcanivorax dieselolei B5]